MTAPRFVADDYGLCPSVDRAIEALAEAGALTGISVMATHVDPQALRRLASASDVEIGLHLNITEGEPVSAPADIPGMVDAEGRLRSLSQQVGGSALGLLHQAELVNEVAAQWDLVHRWAGRVDYIDGHQHVHMLPGVFSVLTRVTSWPRRSTARVRSGAFTGARRSARDAVIAACARLNARRHPDAPFDASLRVVDYRDFDPGVHGSACEVMLHVAHPDVAAPTLDATSYRYAERVAQFQRRMADVRGAAA